jgi:hypothetical protein
MGFSIGSVRNQPSPRSIAIRSPGRRRSAAPGLRFCRRTSAPVGSRMRGLSGCTIGFSTPRSSRLPAAARKRDSPRRAAILRRRGLTAPGSTSVPTVRLNRESRVLVSKVPVSAVPPDLNQAGLDLMGLDQAGLDQAAARDQTSAVRMDLRLDPVAPVTARRPEVVRHALYPLAPLNASAKRHRAALMSDLAHRRCAGACP